MEPAGSHLHLHVCHPGQITDPELLDDYCSLLSEDETVQMGRFYYERDRHQYLVTRALIRSCLSTFFPCKPADWKFDTNAYGKPCISLPGKSFPVSFNLSHTNGLIICGIVRDDDIGVDVEDLQRSTRSGLVRLSSFFSALEIAELKQLPAAQQKQRFFDYWTLKESYIKARGAGLSIPLDKFSFHFAGDKLEGISIHPDLNDNAEHWQFWRISVARRYRIAVAVNSEDKHFKLSAYKTIPMRGSESFSPIVM